MRFSDGGGHGEPLLTDVEVGAGEQPAGFGAPGPKFRIKGLTKLSESGETILAGLNVDIPRGLIVGIIGPSGSGKSTLLRALNRLWEPPAGTVFLDGDDILDIDVLALRRKVGMLFQLPALFEGTISSNPPPPLFCESIWRSLTRNTRPGLGKPDDWSERRRAKERPPLSVQNLFLFFCFLCRDALHFSSTKKKKASGPAFSFVGPHIFVLAAVPWPILSIYRLCFFFFLMGF